MASRGARASHCGGFSGCGMSSRRTDFGGSSAWAQLGLLDSVVGAHGFNCSAACGTFRPEIEPRTPALAGDSDPPYHQGSPIISNLFFFQLQQI